MQHKNCKVENNKGDVHKFLYVQSICIILWANGNREFTNAKHAARILSALANSRRYTWKVQYM